MFNCHEIIHQISGPLEVWADWQSMCHVSLLVSVFPVRLLFSGISPEMGHVLDFLHYDDNMRLWLSRPPHACKTQSDEPCSTCPSFPVAKTERMSLLRARSCHKSQRAWPAWCTGRSGCSGQQIARSVRSEGAHLSDERSLGVSDLADSVPLTPPYVFQHLYRNVSQLQTRRKRGKTAWPCAILPDALLSSVSPQRAPLLQLCLPLMRRGRGAHWANAN